EVHEEIPQAFISKLKLSFLKAWGDFTSILIYLLIGVGIGAVIYGYLPEEFVLKYAGFDNPLAVPIAAVIGIPLYIRVETAIPIGVSLMQKGMSVGAVIALIIGGAGMAIPEMSMLASIFKKKLVGAIVAVIFLTAVIGGYVFNIIM
ncbi:MAG: permease, partial [Dehalobacterium sp.]